MIAIVDSGGANLASVTNALERLQVTAQITSDPARIRKSSHVILPGVGAAQDCMERLSVSELILCLRKLTQPVLGLCLGLQILFEHSEEGNTGCLGVLPGSVIKMRPKDRLTVPHMGWNRVHPTGDPSPLFQSIDPGSYFYFVHSYCAPMGPWVVATTEHGGMIPAVVQKGNYFGAQFHPEKSGRDGAMFLRNFLKL